MNHIMMEAKGEVALHWPRWVAQVRLRWNGGCACESCGHVTRWGPIGNCHHLMRLGFSPPDCRHEHRGVAPIWARRVWLQEL